MGRRTRAGQLFDIYQRQQRLGEQYEVGVGLGLLSWKPTEAYEIKRHLIFARGNISFDSRRGVISLSPGSDGAQPVLEQEMLRDVERLDPDQALALEAQVAEIAESVWDPSQVDVALRSWVHSASSRGSYDETLSPQERAKDDPVVHLAPAVILRKRTERSYIETFREIIKRLQDGEEVPHAVEQFVSILDDGAHESAGGPAGDGGGEAGGHCELREQFLPLQCNEEQREIVRRLESHRGVLVQGPPGTGKSHTIVNLICHLLAHGQRVLVTSHAPRALQVLRRYIDQHVSDIAPLSVLVLGNDRESLQAMEDSVQGITDKHHSWSRTASDAEVTRLECEREEARRKQAALEGELRSIRESETYRHPSRPGGFEGTAQKIAEEIRGGRERFAWFTDEPREDVAVPVSSAEALELLALLRRSDLVGDDPDGPLVADPTTLPSPEEASDIFRRHRAAESERAEVREWEGHAAYEPLRRAHVDSRRVLRSQLTELQQSRTTVARHIQAWARNAARQVLADQDRPWRELFEMTRARLNGLRDKARAADEVDISGLSDRSLVEVKADAAGLLAHVNAGGSVRRLLPPKPVRQALYLVRDVRVDGRACDNPDSLRKLIDFLDVEETLQFLSRLWAAHADVSSATRTQQVAEYEDLCEPLEAALDLHPKMEALQSSVSGISGLAAPAWHEEEEVVRLLAVLELIDREGALDEANAAVASARHRVHCCLLKDPEEPLRRRLDEAFARGDADSYAAAFRLLQRAHEMQESRARRANLFARLSDAMPALAEQLVGSPEDPIWEKHLGALDLAWDRARTLMWLRRLSDPREQERVTIALDSCRERLAEITSELSAARAWTHCFQRMTERERQALNAWSAAMKRLGKGTGKHAPTHRRAAQQHMADCRSAIPAWIMPIHRVAETIKPGTDRFDVVIVDEASQSGPEALFLLYLAEKVVVVGDDKQISPESVGMAREAVHRLQEVYLKDVPHRDSYGADNSLFDLAQIRYPGRIRLREHFRCMPEIIQFSNLLCYGREPLLPLKQYGAGRLEPVIETHHVVDGYVEGSSYSLRNAPEAEALAAQVLRCHEDSKYSGKTFGVISLQGGNQARHITKVLLDRMGPEAMEERALICGDAYAFQGDERDVMFLSMVQAPSEGKRIGVLSREADSRRFNVAMSRAKEQVHLFHSATLNDLSPACLRYRLLDYCLHPRVEMASVAGVDVEKVRELAQTADRGRTRPPSPFDSWFEVDVFLQLADRGFFVVPQFEMAGYRVDLMVQGMRGRLAVECDGDRWHGPEEYLKDVTRERQLERCGCPVWRVRGSAYYVDPDAALEPLWKMLRHHRIFAGAQAAEEEVGDARSRGSSGGPGYERSGPAANPSGNSHATEEIASADDADGCDRQFAERPTSLVEHGVDRGIPYKSWPPHPVPDPRSCDVRQLVAGVVEIVQAEGPIVGRRVCQVYARAAGVQRLRQEPREALHEAIRQAVRQGLIVERNEEGSDDIEERVLRGTDAPAVMVRPHSDRDLHDVPASEVATVMQRLLGENPRLSSEALYRATLDVFGLKRLTESTRARLAWIDEHRGDLIQVATAAAGPTLH